ncbi:MAG: diiron oxygenase [Sandaracinaceae bacterium]
MTYSYASILKDARKAQWDLDVLTAELHELDFGRPFLPDELVHVNALSFLGEGERIRANQIRANSYLQMFALVERFILPFVMVNASSAMRRSTEELLALMAFGEEEAKHIALFERFSDAFEVGFGSLCEVVGPGDEIAGVVLAEEPLAVAVCVLHIEWMTQDHYLRSVRGRRSAAASIDPRFEELLRAHWAEEAQHAKIDCLLLERMAARASEAERHRAKQTYVKLMDKMAEVFRQQVELDIEAYERAVGRLEDAERDRWRATQVPAYHEAFLRTGVVHRRFRETVGRTLGDAPGLFDDAARRWAGPVPRERCQG